MKYNILVVDDEIYTLEDICSCINKEALGIGEVFTAVNTAKALSVLEEQTVHIILSDIDMPGGDGISFLRTVRDLQADTPCIFITNYADFTYAQEAIHLKVLDYLLKPVEPEQLNGVLERAVAIAAENAGPDAFAVRGSGALPDKDKSPDSGKSSAPDPGKRPAGDAGAAPNQRDQYIRSAAAFIESHLLDNVTRESVASFVHITPDHLDRLFREQLGMSAFRYIVQKKIECAKSLLSGTDRPVSVIAADLGYGNLSNFALAFRKQTGITPVEYRKLHT